MGRRPARAHQFGCLWNGEDEPDMHIASRQVHLDFHTSEQIEKIGRKFDKRQWQAALKAAHLNSITVFAKCHHGNCYYPAQSGTMHPHLKFDLMGRQIEASHEIGVRAPIYITVGWSVRDSAAHPEWRVRDRSGSIVAVNTDRNARPTDRRPACSWDFLCPSGEYKRHILDLTREICSRYPVDGFFYDICNQAVCFCVNCQAGMAARGLDPADDAQAREYTVAKWTAFMSACREIAHRDHPEATIYFNGTAELHTPEAIKALNTHFELEDLPTTWGGYDKFPLRSKFFARSGKDMLAMSGKFHTSWGEFGGFKHPDALKFEAACMIGFGARCSFGDQLHPSGEMDLATYRNIGVAYKYVKQIEQYGLDGTPLANLGIMLSGQPPSHDRGVANMLMESQIDFEVVSDGDDLARFDALILTGGRMLDRDSASRIRRFVELGGGLLVLGESALEPETDEVLLDVGARYMGPGRFDCDYLAAGREIGRGLVASPFLNYTAAPRFKTGRAKLLARIYEPFFSRTYEHYCSHRNTPNRPEPAEQAGVFQFGRIVSLAHPVGALYLEHGLRLHRQLFVNALRRIYCRQLLAVTLPSAGRVNLLHQPGRKRYVAHLFYSPPLQRGQCLVIEDMVPLRNVQVSLRVPQPIQRVSLPLAKRTLTAKKAGGALCVTIPEMTGHQIVVFHYG